MALIANIVLADGSATPVNVTFTPETVTDIVKTFVDRRLAVRNQQPTLSYSFGTPAKAESPYGVSVRVALPHVRTGAGGVESVEGTSRIFIDAKLWQGTTAQERKHLVAYARNALDNALIKAGFVDLEPIWG